jgi:hypothetical protein
VNWRIERDDKGQPVRMVWLGPGKLRSAHNDALDKMIARNSLPMPGMREWARAHGLYEGGGTADSTGRPQPM